MSPRMAFRSARSWLRNLRPKRRESWHPWTPEELDRWNTEFQARRRRRTKEREQHRRLLRRKGAESWPT